MFLSIGKAAGFLGVSISTLRRWEKNCKLNSTFKTSGGHRRYSLAELKIFCGECPQKSSRKAIEFLGMIKKRILKGN